MAERRINRSIVISVIPEANNHNLYLKITDYWFDTKDNRVVFNCIFKNQETQVPIQDEPLNQNDYPNTLGKRYIKIQNNIFFLEKASDNAGAF